MVLLVSVFGHLVEISQYQKIFSPPENGAFGSKIVKTIHVSNGTWRSLQEIKLDRGYKTLDEAITHLLSNRGEKGEK